MNCHRCNGLMYRMELRDSKGFERLKALVCVICGEIVDPVIAVNRQRDLSLKVRLPKRAARLGKYWKKLGRLPISPGGVEHEIRP
ncbi:MAG: hypothetical protein LAP85_07035 [Acidobacteriia bacterium]|nr:hypothetical protein [Terriglobia bacterium]